MKSKIDYPRLMGHPEILKRWAKSRFKTFPPLSGIINTHHCFWGDRQGGDGLPT